MPVIRKSPSGSASRAAELRAAAAAAPRVGIKRARRASASLPKLRRSASAAKGAAKGQAKEARKSKTREAETKATLKAALAPWDKEKPKTQAERRTLLETCGPSGFLLPEELKYPVQTIDCVDSCTGLKSAAIRASMLGHKDFAAEARARHEKVGC